MATSSFRISQLAVPSVCFLISFLAYGSQYFFRHFEPAPLRDTELWRINIFALCIWICYYRTCTVDPGRIPKDWRPVDSNQLEADRSGRHRWCRKCEAYKPPRAHHCRTCQRCIPRMDHHCPWTSNCVSHFTLPHFIRFLFYTVTGMSYLETLLYERASIVWASRNLPSYLGPSAMQMAFLFVLLVLNSFTTFFLVILFVRTIWSLSINTTTIEDWEIERHQTLVRRARHFGGYLTGPGGVRVRIQKQEFPYDIGILSNIKAGMGGSWNILAWFSPLARTSDRKTGLDFEVNGFEDPNVFWPPPDPDRIPVAAKKNYRNDPSAAFTHTEGSLLSEPVPTADQKVRRRKRFHDRFSEPQSEPDSSNAGESPSYSTESSSDGEEGWRNSEGERLRDFGVEEDIEFYDEEDIPLAILMQRRADHQ
ncbi:zf-DHHC-domain-containing protein [Aspergillus heteromorphus CBS 117.55]|uniref:Palmitoyltransferase PFA4 n=1 Tax=Aspergillus heteromorphus CBS 117.55 TaxID=1448321 RepID=A0A317WRW6_9EURO|nr:zf-DHHC-domain-containing protein [Aspergillus heteromorphus CBS 117.55]PWY89194.1 zf-DHHC-domain-containing protein [Aspergillus heteromorphus CBS 117.55]